MPAKQQDACDLLTRRGRDPTGLLKPQRGVFPGFWPDGRLRLAEPLDLVRAAKEMHCVIDALNAMNNTLLFTAFYQYHAHIGQLEIQIFEGRWNPTKAPIRTLELDCRHYPLREWDSERVFYAQRFVEELILLVQ